jgi:cytochrome b561
MFSDRSEYTNMYSSLNPSINWTLLETLLYKVHKTIGLQIALVIFRITISVKLGKLSIPKSSHSKENES